MLLLLQQLSLYIKQAARRPICRGLTYGKPPGVSWFFVTQYFHFFIL